MKRSACLAAALATVAAAGALGCGGSGRRVPADESSTGNWQQRLSAGVLGCRPGRIEITEHYEGVTDSWIATCAGRSIICGWARGSGAPLCADLGE